MIRPEDVQRKVEAFVKTEFPEVWNDIQGSGLIEEFAGALFDLVEGSFQEEPGDDAPLAGEERPADEDDD